MRNCDFVWRSLVHELRAGHDGFRQGAETIVILRELRTHVLNGGIVGKNQRAAKAVGQQFAAKVVHEIILAMFANVAAQTFKSISFAAAGKFRARVDGASAEIFRAALRQFLGESTFKQRLATLASFKPVLRQAVTILPPIG